MRGRPGDHRDVVGGRPQRGAQAQETEPGRIVAGKYKIERVAGAGGMGMVLVATDVQLLRQVAIKVMSPLLAEDEHAVRRFLREARSAVRLTGEHVARVFEAGELPSGTPYIVMEYLDGRDLETMVSSRGRLPSREAVDFILQALEGVAEAHAAGIVHRDLKPANLFVSRRRDGRPLVKVLDFGLAKNLLRPGETALTSASTVMGTHHYMSPEQLRGSRDVDSRTDIWAVGVSLYQLVTGGMPFDLARVDHKLFGRGVAALSQMIIRGAPIPPHVAVPDVPLGLSEIILRCLEKEPRARFRDVAELAGALEAYASAEYAGIGARLEFVLEEETRIEGVREIGVGDDTIVMEDLNTEKVERIPHGDGERAPWWNIVRRAVLAVRSSLRRGAADGVATVMAVRPSTFDSLLHRARRPRVWLVVLLLMVVAIVVPVLAILAERARTRSRVGTAVTASPAPSAAPTSTARGESTGGPSAAPVGSTPNVASGHPPLATPNESSSASVADPAAAASPPIASSRPATPSTPSNSNTDERSPAAPAASPAPSKASGSKCSPPYTVGADGIRHWKLECL